MLYRYVMQENLKQMWEQWKRLDAKAKAPYQARAANDANRYRREVNCSIILACTILSQLKLSAVFLCHLVP